MCLLQAIYVGLTHLEKWVVTLQIYIYTYIDMYTVYTILYNPTHSHQSSFRPGLRFRISRCAGLQAEAPGSHQEPWHLAQRGATLDALEILNIMILMFGRFCWWFGESVKLILWKILADDIIWCLMFEDLFLQRFHPAIPTRFSAGGGQLEGWFGGLQMAAGLGNLLWVNPL